MLEKKRDLYGESCHNCFVIFFSIVNLLPLCGFDNLLNHVKYYVCFYMIILTVSTYDMVRRGIEWKCLTYVIFDMVKSDKTILLSSHENITLSKNICPNENVTFTHSK